MTILKVKHRHNIESARFSQKVIRPFHTSYHLCVFRGSLL